MSEKMRMHFNNYEIADYKRANRIYVNPSVQLTKDMRQETTGEAADLQKGIWEP